MRKHLVIFATASILLLVIAVLLAKFEPKSEAAGAMPSPVVPTHQLFQTTSQTSNDKTAPDKVAVYVRNAGNIDSHLTTAFDLDPKKPVDKVALLISSNEGKLTTIDWNDNGHGVSVGMFQANQKVGQLPEMLQKMSMDDHGYRVLSSVMGKQFADRMKSNPNALCTMNIGPNTDMGKRLRKLVWMKDFQQLQIDMLRNKVKKAACVAKTHGIKSTAGVAVFADLTNQWGPGGAEKFVRYANRYQSEGAKLKAIVQAVKQSSAYGSRYQEDLKKAECYGLTLSDAFPPPS